jgi:hypothetical protein
MPRPPVGELSPPPDLLETLTGPPGPRGIVPTGSSKASTGSAEPAEASAQPAALAESTPQKREKPTKAPKTPTQRLTINLPADAARWLNDEVCRRRNAGGPRRGKADFSSILAEAIDVYRRRTS